MLYATSDTYAVAVLVFAHLLRQLEPPGELDLVMLYTGVSADLLALAREMGLRVVRVAAPARARGWYFRDCLVKLRALQLYEYERILCLDADAIPLRGLAALTQTAIPGGIAAAPAYWLKQRSWSSALFVAAPSADLWALVEQQLPLVFRRSWYDGEILNAAFAGRTTSLPEDALRLNSDWEDVANALESNPRVVHFSALGKPWSFKPDQVRKRRPKAHPFFYETWERWWDAREDLFRGCGRALRFRHSVGRALCQMIWLKKGLDFLRSGLPRS